LTDNSFDISAISSDTSASADGETGCCLLETAARDERVHEIDVYEGSERTDFADFLAPQPKLPVHKSHIGFMIPPEPFRNKKNGSRPWAQAQKLPRLKSYTDEKIDGDRENNSVHGSVCTDSTPYKFNCSVEEPEIPAINIGREFDHETSPQDNDEFSLGFGKSTQLIQDAHRNSRVTVKKNRLTRSMSAPVQPSLNLQRSCAESSRGVIDVPDGVVGENRLLSPSSSSASGVPEYFPCGISFSQPDPVAHQHFTFTEPRESQIKSRFHDSPNPTVRDSKGADYRTPTTEIRQRTIYGDGHFQFGTSRPAPRTALDRLLRRCLDSEEEASVVQKVAEVHTLGRTRIDVADADSKPFNFRTETTGSLFGSPPGSNQTGPVLECVKLRSRQNSEDKNFFNRTFPQRIHSAEDYQLSLTAGMVRSNSDSFCGGHHEADEGLHMMLLDSLAVDGRHSDAFPGDVQPGQRRISRDDTVIIPTMAYLNDSNNSFALSDAHISNISHPSVAKKTYKDRFSMAKFRRLSVGRSRRNVNKISAISALDDSGDSIVMFEAAAISQAISAVLTNIVSNPSQLLGGTFAHAYENGKPVVSDGTDKVRTVRFVSTTKELFLTIAVEGRMSKKEEVQVVSLEQGWTYFPVSPQGFIIVSQSGSFSTVTYFISQNVADRITIDKKRSFHPLQYITAQYQLFNDMSARFSTDPSKTQHTPVRKEVEVVGDPIRSASVSDTGSGSAFGAVDPNADTDVDDDEYVMDMCLTQVGAPTEISFSDVGVNDVGMVVCGEHLLGKETVESFAMVAASQTFLNIGQSFPNILRRIMQFADATSIKATMCTSKACAVGVSISTADSKEYNVIPSLHELVVGFEKVGFVETDVRNSAQLRKACISKWELFLSTFCTGKYLSSGACKSVYAVAPIFGSRGQSTQSAAPTQAISVMDLQDLQARNAGSVSILDILRNEVTISQLCTQLCTLNICPCLPRVHCVFTSPYPAPQVIWTDSGRVRELISEATSVKSWSLQKQQCASSRHVENQCPVHIKDVYDAGVLNKISYSVSALANRTASNNEPKVENICRYQYMCMELCDLGDTETFLKEQCAQTISVTGRAGALGVFDLQCALFQMSYSLFAVREQLKMRHFDVKLLNFFGSSGLSLLSDPELAALREQRSSPVNSYHGCGTEVTSRKYPTSANIEMHVGFGRCTFRVPIQDSSTVCGLGLIKLADFGTSLVGARMTVREEDSIGVEQFTTLENTPPEYLFFGSGITHAQAYKGTDVWCLGLCAIHLLTMSALPYEELMADCVCPVYLLQQLRAVWEHKKFAKPTKRSTEAATLADYAIVGEVIDSLIDDEEDEFDDSSDGDPSHPCRVLYDTIYRYAVLLGIDSADEDLDFDAGSCSACVDGFCGDDNNVVHKILLDALTDSQKTVSSRRADRVKCRESFAADRSKWGLRSGTHSAMRTLVNY
jgi:serine/threonine protein kinase